MRGTTTMAVALVLAATSCSRASTAPAAGDAGTASSARAKGPGMGEVMALVGRRFEVAGRAMVANRFELAEFEVGELGELFEDDVPGAELPKEGPTGHIPAMAQAFLQTNVPELKKAAAAKDPAAFREAFANLGYVVCNDDQFEGGYEKVALFALAGEPKHVARQLPNGRWTSKLGPMEDVEHALHDLTRMVYGSVVLVMKRPLSAAEKGEVDRAP